MGFFFSVIVPYTYDFFFFFFNAEMYIYLYSGVNVKMTAGSAEQVKPGDLASGARRTENWIRE